MQVFGKEEGSCVIFLLRGEDLGVFFASIEMYDEIVDRRQEGLQREEGMTHSKCPRGIFEPGPLE